MSALILDKCVFLHVPKTGGTWALEALRSQGLPLATVNAPDGATHPTLEQVRSVIDLPAIATVRDPVSWLQSFWRFFYARNWRDAAPPHPAFDPLLAMAADSFSEFAARYLNRRPGYVSELLARYSDGAEHVCRQEELLPDLIKAFERFGQPHLPGKLGDVPWRNASRPFDASCSEEIEIAIREADEWILKEFYGAP